MTQYAPVAPLAGLRQLAQADQLGRYQLLIAPIILEREEAYRQFFKVHNDQFVIVDNGVIELGYPLDARRLAMAALTVGANVVVMPDTIDDGKMTAKQVRFSLPEYRRYDEVTDVMGVVQGVTIEECVECARALVEAGVSWLGVPRGLTPNLGSRVPLVQVLAHEHGLPMHVLGFSNNIQDDLMAAVAHPLVRGIDAATPVWMKSELPMFPPTDAERALALGRRPKNFWSSIPGPLLCANVETVRSWLSDAQNARMGGQGPAAQVVLPTQP